MKKLIRAKIRSKRGASLIYAMLILLVCTVISSVVLAAATAAAGRIVKTGETDRRYYVVNSTVNLIKEILPEATYNFDWSYRQTKDGETKVTVDYLKNSTYAESFGENKNLSELLMETLIDDEKVYTAAKYGTRNNEVLSDIFMNASLDLLVGTGRTDKSDITGLMSETLLADSWSNTKFEESKTVNNFTIKMEGRNRKDVCEVSVRTTLEANGKLTITISCGEDNENGKAYTVKMVFRPDIEDNTTVTQNNDIKVGDAVTSYDSLGRTVTTQKIRRVVQYDRRVTYKWNLDSVANVDTPNT